MEHEVSESSKSSESSEASESSKSSEFSEASQSSSSASPVRLGSSSSSSSSSNSSSSSRERDVVDYIIYGSKQGVSELQLRQVLGWLDVRQLWFRVVEFWVICFARRTYEVHSCFKSVSLLSLRGYEDEDMKTRV